MIKFGNNIFYINSESQPNLERKETSTLNSQNMNKQKISMSNPSASLGISKLRNMKILKIKISNIDYMTFHI